MATVTVSLDGTSKQIVVQESQVKQLFGAENVEGWGSGETARSVSLLGATVDRHDWWDQGRIDTMTSAGVQFIALVDSDTGLTQLSPLSYASTLAGQVKQFPGITRWELLNEPFGWWYRGGDNDPASYGKIARAAITTAKLANPKARFYVALRNEGEDVKLKDGTWIQDWNARVLAAAPDLFQLCDGFTCHAYDTPTSVGALLDKTKAWAWSQPGGNGKPFQITECNLSDQTSQTEAAEVAAMTGLVQMVKARPWIESLLVYAWKSTSQPWLSFLNSDGTPKASRCAAFKAAVQGPVQTVKAIEATAIGGNAMKAKVHPKVKAGVGVGGVGALVAWIVGQYGVPVPPEVAVAVNTIAAFVASYFTSSTPTP